jgi:predicted phage terminase large subunit-like protein
MPKASTNRFVAEMCRESYYEFFLEFWPLVAAETLHDAWYIRKLCDELQAISERVFRSVPKEYDLIWNCPPGTSKSSIVSILWQPWIWTRMPSARFISGSYSERLALDLSRKSRDVVTSEKYRRLFPNIQLRDDQNTKGYFANTKGGIRYAVGVGGTVIGIHAHFIAVDDPIDPQGALSDLILADSNNWMTETLSRRKVNVMLTPTVLIMQRLHQDDPSGNMVERGGRVRQFILPGDDTWEIKPTTLKEYYSQDGLLDPVRIPREGLDEAYRELGEAGYAGQYGQSPIPRGGAMFKVDRLHFATQLPTKWKRGPIRYWDKAGTLKGGAFTVGTREALSLDDKLWVIDVVRGQWDSGLREKKIDETAALDGKSTRQDFEQEPGSSGKGDAEASVRRLTQKGYRASADKVTGDKELRADLFSQWVNLGDVVIYVAPWNRDFIQELRFFPRSKYKDQVDSASGAASRLIKPRTRIGVYK